MENNDIHNVEYFQRSQYVTKFILVDGISRAGKFLLAHIVGSMEGIEFIQSSLWPETILYLARLAKIDLETARIMMQSDIDMNTYNMAIGRGLNCRISDASCIYKAPNISRFLSRTVENDPDVLIKEFQEHNYSPLYVGHECLCNSSLLFNIYPEIKLISLQRDPLSLIMSWYKRGWGKRFGVDPRSMVIIFKTQTGCAPWFALDWAQEYSTFSEMDRVIKSIEALFRYAKQSYEELSLEQQASIHFVAFDDILLKPVKVVDRLSQYLNREPVENMNAILARERVPRIIPENQRELLLNEIRSHMSHNMEDVLQALLLDFDTYWMGMVNNRIQ